MPDRLLLKATRAPSRDQIAPELTAEPLTTTNSALASDARIRISRSGFPGSTSTSYAMNRPSGESAGLPAACQSNDFNVRTVPSIVDIHAIREVLPSPMMTTSTDLASADHPLT